MSTADRHLTRPGVAWAEPLGRGPGADHGGPPASAAAGARWPFLRWVRRGATLLALLAVVDFFVLPQISGTRRALDLLHTVRPGWVIVAALLEASSLGCYSLLTRSVLLGGPPRYSWLLRTDVTALGLGHLLPGGGATATALRYRLLREGGASGGDVAAGMAVQGVGATVVLAAMLWVALVVAVVLLGMRPLYVSAAVVGAVLIAAVVVAVARRPVHPVPKAGALARMIGHLPRRYRPRVRHWVDEVSQQLRQLLADRGELRASATWAAAYWALDAASLWMFLAAFGHRVNPAGLFVAYGLANVAAVLPISPGGLGIIEAVLIPSLVGFGTPRAVAALGVVSWRLVNFWAPIPAAGICYLSLRTQRWWNRHRSHRRPPP